MKLATILASACVGIVAEPPILPFTEISDDKLSTMLINLAKANEVTLQDYKVVLQLEHVNWKYNQMRDIFYETARNAKDGTTINSKDLGKMWDSIDLKLESLREEKLQEILKNSRNIEENNKMKIGKEI